METESATRITLVDEIERGLEPYRLRKLITKITSQEAGQSFVTTHSPSAIKAAVGGHLWFIDGTGNIGELNPSKIRIQQGNAPETFLSKLTIVCEGVTEVGFLCYLLHQVPRFSPEDNGLLVSDGKGNEPACDLLSATTKAGLRFGGFVDNDNIKPGVWLQNKLDLGDLLLQWEEGCTESNIIKFVDDSDLERFVVDPSDDLTGIRLRHLCDRLSIERTDFHSIKIAAKEQNVEIRNLILEAATGNTESATTKELKKAWKKHQQDWFKSERGGDELARKIFELQVWPKLKPTLLPFINAILIELGIEEIQNISA